MRLEYAFHLLPIALERQDLLAYQVRDHGDDLRAIQTRTESLEAMVEQQAAKLANLEEDRHTMAYARFEVADPMRKHLDTLVWTKPKTPSPFQLSDGGKSIRFPTAGLFMITANLGHNSASKGTHYVFCVNDQPAEVLSGHHVNGFQTSSFTTVMAFSDGEALSVDYCGGNYSNGGALTIVELRRN